MSKSARGERALRRVWRDVSDHIAAYTFAVGGPLLLAATTCYLGTRFFSGTTSSLPNLHLADEPQPLLRLLVSLTLILIASQICGACSCASDSQKCSVKSSPASPSGRRC